MSELAKKARAAMKSKAQRLGNDRPLQKVDSSTFTPPEMLNADVKTGMRPISRRAYKKGGKVTGDACVARADRKPRKNGGSALTADSLMNRNQKEANEQREGKKHIGGLKKGGRVGKYTGGARNEREHAAMMELAEKEYGERQKMSDADKANLPGRKAGGRTKKADGGEMLEQLGPGIAGAAKMARGANRAGVPAGMMQFGRTTRGSLSPAKAVGIGGMKKGGTAEKHDDEKADRALIKKMVKPSARTGKAEGGERKGRATGGNVFSGAGYPDKVPGVVSGGRTAKATGGKTPANAKRAGKFYGGAMGQMPPQAMGQMPQLPPQAMGGMGMGMGQGQMPQLPQQAMDAAGAMAQGRPFRKAGGRAKDKTNINIVIAAGKPAGGQDMMGKPPGGLPTDNRGAGGIPVPMSMPPGGGGGMPGGGVPMPMPIPMPPAGGPPAPQGGMPMGRKTGGRVSKVASSYKDMEAGSGGGEGRLQKTDVAKKHKDAPAYRKGGKVYRSYKDMDAGAGSGAGRLEKTEIQSRKR